MYRGTSTVVEANVHTYIHCTAKKTIKDITFLEISYLHKVHVIQKYKYGKN